MPFADTIDIPPCLSVTFGEKLDLIKALRFVNITTDEFLHKTALRRLDWGGIHEACRHQCLVDDHRLAKVTIATIIMWNNNTHTLRVQSTYEFHDTEAYVKIRCASNNRDALKMELAWQGIRTPFECPHWNPTSWLRRFFSEAGLTYHSLDQTKQVSPLACDCFRKRESYNSIKITVYHDLGGVDYPVKSPIFKCLSKFGKCLTKRAVTEILL